MAVDNNRSTERPEVLEYGGEAKLAFPCASRGAVADTGRSHLVTQIASPSGGSRLSIQGRGRLNGEAGSGEPAAVCHTCGVAT